MAPAETFPQKLRTGFSRSLRARVLGLTLLAFALVAIPALVGFVWIVDATTVKLSTLFAERQILYDRHRGLGPLKREVALAETLARSPTIAAWALDEASPEWKERGLAELEHFRLAFQDRSYFFAVAESGNYYYNDRANGFAGDQLRYTLRLDKPDDSWFFRTLALGPGCRLNVNNDWALKVTKVWINCVVHAGGAPVAVLGTGIELTQFIGEVVNTDQPGVESLFIDASGAIQVIRDRDRIDFQSLTKDLASRKTVFQMLDDQAGQAALGNMMSDLLKGRAEVSARFMKIGGKERLVGVGYLDELDWFNVTLMDVDTIVDRNLFAPIAMLIGLIMAVAAALVTLLFKRSVIDRLAKAEASLDRIEGGDLACTVEDHGADEIGRLTTALNRMAASVRRNTEHLEEAVRERTEQLERIAYLDAMTGVANRRGFAEAFEQARRRHHVDGAPIGLLIMDVDLFKAINDTRGHRAGDEVIVEVARRIADAAGDADICARWGGDEFVLLVTDCTHERLTAVGRELSDALRGRAVTLSDGSGLRITTSIGAHIVAHDDTLSTAAAKADIALYEAKRAGRNRMTVYDPARHAAHDGKMRVA
jgi:diguanylate cyclase (GGDEF)-like protein